MGMQFTFTDTRTGAVHLNAYANLSVTYKPSEEISISISIYTNYLARQEGKHPVHSPYYGITPKMEEFAVLGEEKQKQQGNSLFILCYNYLKTLPLFNGAVDVL